MATEKAETDRVPVTLALSTISYLEKLVRQGTPRHQRTRRSRTLIEKAFGSPSRMGCLRSATMGRRHEGNPEREP